MYLPTQFENEYATLLIELYVLKLYKTKEQLEQIVYDFYEPLFEQFENQSTIVETSIYDYLELRTGQVFKHVSIDHYWQCDYVSIILSISEEIYPFLYFMEGLQYLGHDIYSIQSPLEYLQSLVEDEVFSENIEYIVRDAYESSNEVNYEELETGDTCLFKFHLTETIKDLQMFDDAIELYYMKFKHIDINHSVYKNLENIHTLKNQLLRSFGVVFFGILIIFFYIFNFLRLLKLNRATRGVNSTNDYTRRSK